MNASAGYSAASAVREYPRNPAARGIAAVCVLHLFADLAGLLTAYGIAFWIRFESMAAAVNYEEHYMRLAPRYLVPFFAFLVFAYAMLGLYEGHRRLRRTPLLWNLILANGLLLLLFAASLFFARNSWHMRGFLPVAILLNIPCTFLWRGLSNRFVAACRRRGRLLSRTVVFGRNPVADEICGLSRAGRIKRFLVVRQLPFPGSPEAARAALAEALTPDVSDVFVIDPDAPEEIARELLLGTVFANRGCVVCSPRFLSLHNPFHYGDRVRGLPLVHYARAGASFPASRVRIALSSLLALAALVVLSPVFLLVALAIRLDSPGPVFFRQDRYGIGNRRFRMFKFRTMVRDAESRLRELRDRNESDGALFKMRDDPRVTRVGRFLRKTSLDELPQLVDIVRGEMRFVGPRPLPCPQMDPYIGKWQDIRQAVRPGLTCIWQVAGRSEIGFDGMSSLDLWYVLNRSALLDLRILLYTAWTVLFQHGAY